MAVGLTQPLIQWVPGVKRRRCEVDLSCQSVAEVKLHLQLYLCPPALLNSDGYPIWHNILPLVP